MELLLKSLDLGLPLLLQNIFQYLYVCFEQGKGLKEIIHLKMADYLIKSL